jgi:hypothetical protein
MEAAHGWIGGGAVTTSQKAPASSVAFPASRTAIERCPQRPNLGPTVLETVITIAVIAHPTLPRAVKERILMKPWTAPAVRKSHH